MRQILFMRFDRRPAIFLLGELSKTGGDTLRLAQEQIAKYIRSAVVSRMQKYFAAEKPAEADRGRVTVLDKARLQNLAGRSA